MEISEFDYPLREELIARTPPPERDAARLLLLPRSGGPFAHRSFRELPDLLRPGDLLVVNDARVIRARLRGRKTATGGQAELLLDRPAGGGRWICLGQASKGFKPGQEIVFSGPPGCRARIEAVEGEGWLVVSFDRDPLEVARGGGELPLPPYLGRPPGPADEERYQTIFSRAEGAAAAPTAGLHFTERSFAALEARGIAVGRLTLLVSAGTFLPVRCGRVEDHRMHPERYEIPEPLAVAVAATRAAGGRIVAVGTTSLRALESAWDGNGLRTGPAQTDLFVVPGHRFHVVDGLLTNFHLPRSTLLLLVSAFAGKDRVLSAYAEAAGRGYRFYSYGDCMLIL